MNQDKPKSKPAKRAKAVIETDKDSERRIINTVNVVSAALVGMDPTERDRVIAAVTEIFND